MRVITRGDLDGLASSVFLSVMNDVTDISFAHSRDMQEVEVEVTADDIVVNLPFVPGCGMWFDHHGYEGDRVDVQGDFVGKYGIAPSAACLIFDYYDSPDLAPFADMLVYVDKVDAADLSVEDVTAPEGWVALGYTCDPRSGLGRFYDYFHLLTRSGEKADPDRRDHAAPRSQEPHRGPGRRPGAVFGLPSQQLDYGRQCGHH